MTLSELKVGNIVEFWQKEQQRACHHIGYGDVKTRPDYCERLTMTEDELEECTCCSQCCGCGG